MLTDHGQQRVTEGIDKVKRELTAHGGPFAGLLDADGYEVVEPGSGLLRKPVTGGVGPDMRAQWEAGGADDGIRLQRIGIAARPDGPFLVYLDLQAPTRSNPHGIVEVWVGFTIGLRGPLEITIS